ncbi:MAG: DUF2931 family protein [Janthinobacterium lividum]
MLASLFYPAAGVLLLAGLALTACAQRRPAASASSSSMLPYQTERFRLSAGPTAAEGYPMKIQFGAFVRSDGKNLLVPSGNYLNSKGPWNVSGIAWAVGEEMQPAPERLDILYFSYTEDQFYEGKFALPQQRLYELLKAGFWDTDKNQQTTYNELDVCVLPKGLVVVWLVGPGRQTLVGHYRAQISDVDYQRFNPGVDRVKAVRYYQAEMLPAVQAQIAASTISSKPWEEYLTTYPWQLALPPGPTLTSYRLYYQSGEYTSGPDTRDPAPYVRALLTPQPRPVPRSGTLWVRDEAGHAYRLRVRRFDEAETQAAFRTLHQASPTQLLTLRVEADKYLKQATLVLTNGPQTIPLPKSSVEILPED